MSPKKPSKKPGEQDHLIVGVGLPGKVTTDAPPPEVLTEISKMFLEIKGQMDKREEDDEIDKDELKDILEKIEREINRGDSANPAKLERWLGNLSSAAPDVFDVTMTLLLESTFHLPRFVRRIIQKIRESN